MTHERKPAKVAAEKALRFTLDEAGKECGSGPYMLVNGGNYDIRRLAVGPGGAHGPGRHQGDAAVYVSKGSVIFEVNDQPYPLEVGDILWVPAGAERGFVAGHSGAVLLAIHLPRGEWAHAAELDNTPTIAQVARHHAQMALRLQLLTADVAEAEERRAFVAALRVLLAYWHGEVLPHATSEEGTIYAQAQQLSGASPLLTSLILDHHELGERVRDLESLLAKAREDEAAEAWEEARLHTAMVASQAQALFGIHARKENECLLPLFAAAGRDLGPVLEEMEQAFGAAKNAAERDLDDRVFAASREDDC